MGKFITTIPGGMVETKELKTLRRWIDMAGMERLLRKIWGPLAGFLGCARPCFQIWSTTIHDSNKVKHILSWYFDLFVSEMTRRYFKFSWSTKIRNLIFQECVPLQMQKRLITIVNTRCIPMVLQDTKKCRKRHLLGFKA